MSTAMTRGFNAQTVMRLTGLTHRKLDYLDRIGLVRPSVRQAAGSGSRRVYSFEDLVSVRVVAEIRRAGLSLQTVRGVVEDLRRRHTKPLATLNLKPQGRRLYLRTDNPRTLEDLTAGGQLAMVLPVGKIAQDLDKQVTEISAPVPFTVRAADRVFKALATPDLEVGGYTIEVPGLPGCFSEADSMRSAPRETREAIEAYLGAGVPIAHSKKMAR